MYTGIACKTTHAHVGTGDPDNRLPLTLRTTAAKRIDQCDHLRMRVIGLNMRCLDLWNKGFVRKARATQIIEPVHEISNNVVCATSKASDQPAHTRSLIRAFASRLNIVWLLSYWLEIILSFSA